MVQVLPQPSQLWDHKSVLPFLWQEVPEAGSDSVAQAGLEFEVLLCQHAQHHASNATQAESLSGPLAAL